MKTLIQFFGVLSTAFAVCAILSTGVQAQELTLSKQLTNDKTVTSNTGVIFDTDSENPTLVKIGRDYYLTHINSYAGGFKIYHSRNLMQWVPLTTIKIAESFTPTSVNLTYSDGMFFIYYTTGSLNHTNAQKVENFALYADRIEGPWSKPFALNINNAEHPSHIEGENFTRFLLFSDGKGIEMQENGVESKGEIHKVYTHGHCSDTLADTVCTALRPRHFKHNGVYYQLCTVECNATGTKTFSTVIHRAKKPIGPWEKAQQNPLLATKNIEPGLTYMGNATLISDVDKNWWILFNAADTSTGSNRIITLLAPINWNNEGWPEVKDEIIGKSLTVKPSGETIDLANIKN
jgi:beta-xylosidase